MRNVILIFDATLVKLILDRIVYVHCNCKTSFHFVPPE